MTSTRQQHDLRALVTGAVAGCIAMYFLDPARGRARRHRDHDRSLAALRRAGRYLRREVRVNAASMRGRAHGVAHRFRCATPVEIDDATLSHKVESVLFRDARVPKGRISINSEHGAVFLRGQIDSPELIEQLGRAAAEIAGVRSVENLLHLPGTEAPHPHGGALLREPY